MQQTDICAHALDALEQSRVKKVVMVGRRGPLQASFTIKELREMTRLPHTTAVLHERDFEQCQQILSGIDIHTHKGQKDKVYPPPSSRGVLHHECGSDSTP